jgi:hypothetical protein
MRRFIGEKEALLKLDIIAEQFRRIILITLMLIVGLAKLGSRCHALPGGGML